MKRLKANPNDALAGFSRSRKHSTAAAKADAPAVAMARAREQADVLNDMLGGLGCPRLDIDEEMKRPISRALPKTSKSKKGLHHKASGQ